MTTIITKMVRRELIDKSEASVRLAVHADLYKHIEIVFEPFLIHLEIETVPLHRRLRHGLT